MKQYNLKKRELEKAKEVAKEYIKKGFDVIMNPSFEQLPEELKNLNFTPDIIAMSKDINLIIEIKTANSVKNDNKLLMIADKIKNLNNWEFEFIYTNPKKNYNNYDYINSKNIITYNEAKNSIERVKQFIKIENNSEFLDMGLILSWISIIKILKIHFQEYKKNNLQISDKTLIRDSVILGIINREEQKYLEKLLSKRNSIIHSYNNETVTIKDLKSIITFSENLLKMYNNTLEDE